MRAIGVMVALVALTLAGCADNGSAEAEEDTQQVKFDDKEITAQEGNGVIIGVVIDDRFFPVANATVEIVGEELTEQSDDQGRFVFNDMPPATYFLRATKELHNETKASVVVEAGVLDPKAHQLMMPRQFQQDPYLQTLTEHGFFTCSQANVPGYLYSSSPCDAQSANANLGIIEEDRTKHFDVTEGWQGIVFEMTWESSAQGTSERMGMVVSTEKETRSGDHWFGNFASGDPMYQTIHVGETHPTAQKGGGPSDQIPAEGWNDVSYFMSVRPPPGATCFIWCVPPGLALDQEFDTYITTFYFAPIPEGWSKVNNSPDPFA